MPDPIGLRRTVLGQFNDPDLRGVGDSSDQGEAAAGEVAGVGAESDSDSEPSAAEPAGGGVAAG